jgi:thiamine-monophosphate kinase
MTKLDERQIIKIFQKNFLRKNFVSEDVETFRIGKNFGVIKTDTLVEGTDVPPGMSPSQVARKSIVASVSDFAAKGVKPLYCVISVSLPRDYSRSKILQLAKGFRKAAQEFGFEILGGDTNEGKEVVISVTLFGLTKKIVHRRGARIGDLILVSGPFGITRSGLKIILDGKKASDNFKRLAKKSVLHPNPRLDFGILAAKHMTSAMDSSDGLSTTLNEMARQSHKRFVITHIPKDDRLDDFAKQNRLDLIDLVFNGGEEYEIVATMPPKNLADLKKIASAKKIKLIQIGTVQRGVGVFLQKNQRQIKIRDLGWSHFATRN